MVSRKKCSPQAYLTGIDRTPWLVQNQPRRGPAASGAGGLGIGQCPCALAGRGHGLFALSTGTLMERPDPYLLPVELARGMINQVRNQLFDWQMIGLVAPPGVGEKLVEAIRQLSWAAVRQDEPAVAAELSQRVAADGPGCLTVIGQLLRRTGHRRPSPQRGQARFPDGRRPGNHAAGRRGRHPFSATFNMAVVPVCWREVGASEGEFSWTVSNTQIQWCKSHGLKVCAGPLIRLDARSLPDWIYLWEDDFDNLLASAREFTTAVVTRYRGKIDFWQCAARVNTAENPLAF